jgi:hypothetical protein
MFNTLDGESDKSLMLTLRRHKSFVESWLLVEIEVAILGMKECEPKFFKSGDIILSF